VDEISFRLQSEEQNNENCPYVLTRVYEIADAGGNTTTAKYRIVVEGEEPVAEAETGEGVRLKGAMTTFTAVKDGDWNDPETWGETTLYPQAGDDVFTGGYTITITGTEACNNIEIQTGGTLNHSGATTLQVNGSWTNNGTYTGGTGTIEFTGSNSATIGGTSTTLFEKFILNKASDAIVVEVIGDVEIDGDISGDVLFSSGLLEVAAGGSINFVGNAGLTIGNNAGIFVNGGAFTGGAFSVESDGLFRIDSGTATFGAVSGNSLTIRSTGTLDVRGGTIDIAGRLVVSGGTANISGGTINLNTVGHSSSSLATLNLTTTSDFNMTGGTINFLQPNGSGNLDLSILDGGTKTFGGTLNFGTGTYRISSNASFPDFTSTGNTDFVYRIPVTENGIYNFPLTTSDGTSIPASVTISGSDYDKAYIEVATFDEKHPENANADNYLKRYWEITTSGFTITNYDVTVNYTTDDIAGTESEIAAGLWTGSLPWEKGAAASSNSVTFSGITATSADITGITLDPPTVEIEHGETAEICEGLSINLTTAVSGDSPYTYSWNPTAALDLTDPANPVANPIITTTYEITVTDGNGFTADDEITITVNPLPDAIADSNSPQCEDETLQLTASGGVTYSWTGPNGFTSKEQNPSITNVSVAASGTYNVTVTDANGCIADETTDVTINPLPNVTLDAFSDVCENEAAFSLTGGSPSGGTYSGTGVSGGQFDPATAGVGTHQITYTYTDGNDCTNSTIQSITVLPVPTVSATPSTQTICQGATFEIEISNPNNVAGTTFTWTRNNTDIITGLQESGTVTEIGGIYKITGELYSTDPQNATTTTFTITALANGCESTTTARVTVVDNDPPALGLPDNLSIQCGADTSATSEGTGVASASDACGGEVTITRRDSITGSMCSYTIHRIWTATDESGNSVSGTQRISVSDNTKPNVLSVKDTTVQCPEDIPSPDSSMIIATDNCGDVTINLFSEISNGLEGKPGYCPTSITRTWRITDECGNYMDTIQMIYIDEECDCKECATELSHYWVDMMGNSDSTITLYDLERLDRCCDYDKKDDCISFSIRLDEGAVGVEIAINGATPTPHEWRMDCDPVVMNDGIVCVPGGEFHLFTFCKPGSNLNNYSFRSLSGVTVESEIETRVSCNTEIEASGIYDNPQWTSIYPDNEGDYNNYLYAPGSDVPGSGVNVINPVFFADVNAPSEIQYRICGETGEPSPCTDELGTDCDVITIYVRDSINIDLNINPDMVCDNDILPTLAPDVSPGGVSNYTLEWYSGSGATGTLLETGPTFTPDSDGPYSVKVMDVQSGILCSEKVFDFPITFDLTGPTFTTVPDTLYIQCNDVGAEDLIDTWRYSAKATYTDADGTIVNFTPDNDFVFADLIMECGNVHDVTFTALDQCSNDSIEMSAIVIIDTIPPTITCPPAADNIPADDNLCEVTELVLDAPTATDDCDTDVDISWKKTGATTGTGSDDVAPGPFNVGETLITYYATDDCGNIDSCTQIVTIVDIQPPQISCPPNVTATAEPPGCELEVFTIEDPVVTENCGEYSLTWKKEGATEAADSGNVNNTLFYAGITTVTYYVIDEAGNSDSCSFFVTINDTVPPTIIECPPDITVNADEGLCTAVITVPSPNVEDPCNEIVTITNNSPYKTSDEDASGTYPSGIHEITWTFTDIWENDTTCLQIIEVIDNQAPTLDCPADSSVFADQYKNYASDVEIPHPTHEDNCDYTLFWGMHGATTDTATVFDDKVFIDSPYPQLNVGDNIITYYLVDYNGDTITCSFTITVEAAPVIKCQEDTLVYANENCVHPFDPGVPKLIQGAQSITWTYTINGNTSVSFVGSIGDPGPPEIGIYNFPIGTTTISWRAENMAGHDECEQIITVVDTLAPTYVPPPALFEDCVDPLHLAVYNPAGPNPVVNHIDPLLEKYPSPDFRTLEAGSTALDLDMSNYADNCCAVDDTWSLRWQIDFEDVPDPLVEGATISHDPIAGNGQPSTYVDPVTGNQVDIYLWGDGVYFTEKIHTITYWITDCHGNESQEIVKEIRITPRPEIIKLTGP
jgi:adhesin HecA-like repeat protein